MSLFKSVGKALGSAGNLIGSAFNSITGVTSGGRQSQKYSLQSAAINNKYQKEFAQNAHQWEIEDLQKAGLNPVLSANSGASASGGGVSSASVSGAGINPIETAIGAWNGYEQARNTGADTNRKNAEIDNIDADTLLKHYQTLTEIENGKLTKEERARVEAQKKEILETLAPKIEQIKAEAEKTNEETKRIKGGKAAETLGTAPEEIIDEKINKFNNKGKVNHKFFNDFNKNIGKRNSIFKYK